MSRSHTLDAPDEDSVSAVSAKPLWAAVADGFYVGSRAGSFLGYVDRQPGGLWRAFDAASRVIGDFPDHHAAIAAATDALPEAGLAGSASIG